MRDGCAQSMMKRGTRGLKNPAMIALLASKK
jgi:hypothetical protein